MLISAIAEPSCEKVLSEIEKSLPLADAVEVRLDFLNPDALPKAGRIVSACPLPVIFTFRKASQGGKREISEPERLDLLEQLLTFHPAYCDLEADTDPAAIERIAKKFPRIQLIGSHHDFDKTPADLVSLFNQMQNPHFSRIKIAARAQSSCDLLRLLLFAREFALKIPLCCISMGEFGKPSRVLGRVMGNAFDYSSNEEDFELHRYNLKTLLETFHYRSLNRETRIYGLIGDPIEQSPGHLFHNERFRSHSRNAVYVKMRTSPKELPSLLLLIQKLPFSGLSVTIPLKEEILPLLNQLDQTAKQCGAANTVLIQDGKPFGLNTDAPGALNAIERHFKVKGKKVAILGAGGTARAIAWEAKQRGAEVLVFNRTAGRARDLGAEIGCLGFDLSELPAHFYDLLVNTTTPSPEGKIPIPEDCIRSGAAVMDVVYYPKETPLLKAAKQRGCACIYGKEMFVEQALLQQAAWKLLQ